MQEMRIFYAARKGAPAHEVEAVIQSMREAIKRTTNYLVDPHVTPANLDFDANYARLGGWEPWQREVATGIRFADREPNYHTFVISELDFGRATASILEQAIAAQKLVLFFDADRRVLERVERVLTVDSNNWKCGWSAELA
jgi:hypothetical protein